MSWTLRTLRQEFARSLDSLLTGTATGGSTSTLVDSSIAATYTDDMFNSGQLYIATTTDGLAPQGQLRYISDYTGSSGTFTTGAVFTAAVGAGDSYDCYLRTTKDELDHALMRAVEDQRLYTSLSVNSSTAEYTLTATGLHDVSQIKGISYRYTSDTDVMYTPIAPDRYRLWNNGGVLSLELDGAVLDNNLTLRIEYVAQYDPLNSASFADATVIGGDLNRHLMYAKMYYYERRMVASSGATWDRYSALYQEVLARVSDSEPSPKRRASKAKLQSYDLPPKKLTWPST